MVKAKEENNYWISYADMMSGLMLIFLYIAIITLSNIQNNSSYSSVVEDYSSIKDELYRELYNEFKYDLEKWHAKLNRKTLTISFHEPEILFERGKDYIKPLFKNILNDFYPRYVKILSKEKFKLSILEVRIEGHTSSEWNYNTSSNDAYISNMDLSQRRTSEVLKYVLSMHRIKNYHWIKNKIISVGYSSSQIKLINGYEDKIASRRVEFRVITDAESKLHDLIKYNVKDKKSFAMIDRSKLLSN